MYKQGTFEGNGKEEPVEKRKRPSSEEENEAQKQQHEGVGDSRASGEEKARKMFVNAFLNVGFPKPTFLTHFLVSTPDPALKLEDSFKPGPA